MPDVYKQSFKQNYTNNIELSIFNCGLERCAPGQTWGPGIRDHYLIHLVVSGKGIFEVGGRTWEVSEGDLFFARPSQLIRYTADEQQPWEYSWVGFNGACAHKLAAQLPFTDDAPVHHTSDPDAMRAAFGPEVDTYIEKRGEKYHLDLKQINAMVLRRCGVEHIDLSRDCTVCSCDRFWSHRATGGERGSQGAVIVCQEVTG